VQRCASRHFWSEALAAAEDFLERFPDAIEARTLRPQIDTLRENAEIVQRRQIESSMTELLSGKHYEEALRLARHPVETFRIRPRPKRCANSCRNLKNAPWSDSIVGRHATNRHAVGGSP
jgi:hypothetical protein